MHDFKKKLPWQAALAALITDPEELFTLLELDKCLLEEARAAATLFPFKVSHSFVARMQKRNPHDPLLRQVLPLGAELKIVPGYSQDPLQEEKVNPVRGLLHKYHGRVLITLTSACAVHCRYCFRRYFPYHENNPSKKGWDDIFAYLTKNETISEVILSGGDPLSVSDQLLAQWLDRLHAVSHVKRLRIHTRFPIIIPERVTPSLIELLSSSRFNVAMVLHINHPQEINDAVGAALRPLNQPGITLLNQAVLLKGVNDSAEVLITLSEKLFTLGILPYYLHRLDKTQGTAHFDLSSAHVEALYQTLKQRLPGYLVPRLAQETAGHLSKIF